MFHMYIYTYFSYIHIYVYTYVHIYIDTYLHIYIYTYMFVDRIMEMGERFGKCRVLTAPGRCPYYGWKAHTQFPYSCSNGAWGNFHDANTSSYFYVLLLILKRYKIDLITSSEHSRWGMDVLQLNFHNCVSMWGCCLELDHVLIFFTWKGDNMAIDDKPFWPTDHFQTSAEDQISQQNEECSLIEPTRR